MTIWLVVLVLMASLAGLGYRQGAIRVGFSFVGILLGAMLAMPVGKLLKPLLMAFGVKNPILLAVLGPPIVFVLISALFKVAAMAVHQKVDVHYKYHAGDLRLALWERLNHRLGLCVGLLNGAAYIVLIAFVIYPLSYWSVQTGTSENEPKAIRILNRLGRDLQATGLSKVARAIDPLPAVYYDTADLVGLLYQNSLLEARLQRYPAFLRLAERPEFQELAKDKEFIRMRQERDPVMSVFNHPQVQAIFQNSDLLKLIWGTVVPDLSDLRIFLETGKSPKYDSERILGRWKVNVNGALAMVLRVKPNISSTEMKKLKQYMLAAFAKTSLVAMIDHRALLKNASAVKLPGGGNASQQPVECQWKNLNSNYELTIAGADLTASIEADRLTIEKLGLVFERED